MTQTIKLQLVRAALAVGLTLGLPTAALGSSHREAPAISRDPVADNTDLYAWVTPNTHDKLYILANYIPLEEPSGGPNFAKFSDDVLYEIHIARGDTSLADVVTYQIRFTTAPITYVDPADLTKPPGGGKEFFSQLTGYFSQTYTITKTVAGSAPTVIASNVPVAPPRVGPETQTVGNMFGLFTSATYDDAYAATFITNMGTSGSEGRVFAGPRDDGFYVDLGGIFDLAQLRPKGTAQDGVAGFNVHTIAMEIPTSLLTGTGAFPPSGNTSPSDATTLGIWASASRQKVSILRGDGTVTGAGPWTQVSRLGLPLINEAVIGIQDKDKWNRMKPASDVPVFGAYFLNPVIVRDAEAVGIYMALGVMQPEIDALKSNRLDIINIINIKDFPTPDAHAIPLSATGDVLRVDMALDSQFPNGRAIPGAVPNAEQVDVTDVLLSVLLTTHPTGISDGVDYNDKTFLTSFPFLALPWQGSNEGHGKPTP
jgi:Domain of unknown function (DUF4331)